MKLTLVNLLRDTQHWDYLTPNKEDLTPLSQPRPLNVMSTIISKTEELSQKSHILKLNTQASVCR